MTLSINSELKSIAKNYCRITDTKILPSQLEIELEENPYYPSLLSLCEAFNIFNVENNAFWMTAKELYDNFDGTPMIAFYSTPEIGSDFIIIKKVLSESVIYFHRKDTTVSKETFSDRYRNVVWISGNSDNFNIRYSSDLRKERISVLKSYIFYSFLVVSISLLAALNVTETILFSFLSIFLVKVLGTFISSLLILFEINEDNPFLKNICKIGAKTNCSAVLNSKASRILGLSWGEVGFYYFLSTTLYLIFPVVPFPNKAYCISVLNALAVPYIFFSIFYQWKILKQWCPLCLAIQSVLTFECLWSIINVWQLSSKPEFDAFMLIPAIISILIPIGMWNVFKPFIVHSKDYKIYKPAYIRMKKNPDLFYSFLYKKEKIITGWENLGISVNSGSNVKSIVKVCNPFCKPCDKAHPILDKIIRKNVDVSLKIIFVTHTKEAELVAKHLIAIHAENDLVTLHLALDDWYTNLNKDYNLFCQKYPISSNLDLYNHEVTAMNNWSQKSNITHTPTLFINGYKLPEDFSIKDLNYIF